MLQKIEEEFPAWHPWCGVTGLWYARRRIGLANVTVRAHNLTVLFERITRTEQENNR